MHGGVRALGNGAAGEVLWTPDIALRRPVFRFAGGCYRSSISYNAPLRRYLWCQTLPGGNARFRGGFGIYDVPSRGGRGRRRS